MELTKTNCVMPCFRTRLMASKGRSDSGEQRRSACCRCNWFGENKLGTWLCRAAWARKFSSGKTPNLIPPTIHMPPNVHESWDYETKMANYNPRLLPESYLSDQKKVLNAEEVEWMRKQSPVIMYDEAHHFYNFSLRGRKARDHYADSVILLSATPSVKEWMMLRNASLF